jgi:VCBS repeat-containing protein
VTVNDDGSYTYDPTGVAAFEALTAGETVTDTFNYTIADDNDVTATATVSITVAGVNNPPVVDLNGDAAGLDASATFTENGDAVAIADAALITITDTDNASLTGASVTITNLSDGEDEVLAVDTGDSGIEASYDSATGVLTLTGETSPDLYEQVLGTVTYSNSSENPATGDRLIAVTASDGTDSSDPAAISTISIVAVNDPPLLDLDADNSSGAGGNNYQATFTEGDANLAVADAGDISIADPDNTTIASATITLTNPFDEEESLSVSGDLPDGITASSYDPDTGILTLTGSASLADYQTAIGQVVYNNSSIKPDETDRRIEVVINDGTDDSDVATTTITVISVNEPPIAVDESPIRVNNSSQFPINPVDNDSDPDGDILTLTDLNTEGTSGLITQAGNQVNYTRLSSDAGTDEFSYTITDGNGETATATISVELLSEPTDEAESIEGADFGDNLRGRGGNDTLVGFGGNDTLRGDDGNDSIVGGLGSDSLVGGNDNNIFHYESADDGGGTAFNADATTSIDAQIGEGFYDTIADFEGLGVADGDAIAISGSLVATTDNILLPVQTDISSNVLGGTQNLFAYDDGSDTYLIYDGNGDNTGGDDSRILARLENVTGVTDLSEDDFLFF